MTKLSRPVRFPDGSMVVGPLRRSTARNRRPPTIGQLSAEEARVTHAGILRDISILALLAITIVAGTMILIGALWHNVAMAEIAAGPTIIAGR